VRLRTHVAIEPLPPFPVAQARRDATLMLPAQANVSAETLCQSNSRYE
jgi:hypothetical protein